ncbi:MAG: protein kinase [Candidatus Wallbacteria bacterium]|nr:protein kinase [Candidatus Wallbacteria bacterium]
MSGEVVSRYVVKQRLRALGVHVTCFRAGQQGLDRDVELRVLPASADAAEAERFSREFRTLAGFDHPGLIQVLDVGRTAEHFFYVTYFREAQTLEEMVQAGRLAEQLVAQIACAIASGLGYLHERGQLHRSVAPGTLFYDTALKRAYIGDYSSMAPLEAGKTAEAGADVPVLRLAMTPEARAGSPFDARTDLYLLAATLYRLLTGIDPLAAAARPGSSETAPVEPPIRYAPELSREMDGFLAKALERDPAVRFQTASEMVSAAEHVLKKLELKSLVDRTSETAAAEPSSEEASPTLSRMRVRAATPAGSSARIPSAGGSGLFPRPSVEESTAGVSRAQIRSAVRPSRDRLRAAEGAEDAGAPSLSALRSAEASSPRAGWGRKFRDQAEHVTQPLAGVAARALAGIPEAYRLPAVGLAVFILMAAVAMVWSAGRRPAGSDAVAVETPATQSATATGEEPPEKTGAPRISVEQVRQTPTDLTNFRDRWQQLRRWYVNLPPAKQSALFPYENLMRAKLDFATDPHKACQLLDQLYEKSASELK